MMAEEIEESEGERGDGSLRAEPIFFPPSSRRPYLVLSSQISNAF
jgi:hypothetical protein